MNFRFLKGLLPAAILLTAASANQALAQAITHQVTLPSGVSWCDDSMINGLFTTINAFRVKQGGSALTMSPTGMKDAETRAVQFSQYMATHSPTSPGFNPHEGYDTTASGLGYNLVSENLAYINSDPNWVVNSGWQDANHLAALTAQEANVMGVSCVYSSGIPFWTYEPGIGSGSVPPPNPPSPPPPSPNPGPTGGTPILDSEESAFLALINNYRAQNGLGALQVSTTLQSSSQWMSNDMSAANYFSHTDSLGRSTGARLAAFGYTYSPWGENIAAGYSDAQNTLTQWETACDPDATGACTYAHRKNMLNGSFTAIGIGRAYNANSSYGWYWTTDFGGLLDKPLNPNPTGAPVIKSFTDSPATIAPGQAAILSWSVSGATGLSLDNGIGNVSTATTKSVSPAQTTTYKLTASNSVGSTSAVVTVTVKPATGDNQPPTAPVITSAAAKSATEVDLSWSKSTDNIGVAGYQIVRNGTILTTVAGAATTYADTAVNGNATYIYVVRAYDAAGNVSPASNTVQVTTPVPPVANACPSPATGAFTGCYYTNTALSGNPALARTDPQINFDWVGLSNFSVRWQGNFTFAQGSYTFTAIASDGMRLYIDGALILNKWQDQPAQSYSVQQTLSQGPHLVTVEYYDHTGSASAHLSWQQTNPGQAAPVIGSFSGTPSTITTGQSATLSWTVTGATAISLDNGIGDVTHVTSKLVTPAQTTTYKLTAGNSTGLVSGLVTITVKAAAPDTQPPTAPALTSANAKSSSEVDLGWTPSSDNIGVTGYQILRNGSIIAKVSGSTLSYADTSAAGGATYAYVVKANDAAGNVSAGSNSVQVSTPVSAGSNICPAPATNAFTACYYNNTSLAGNPVLTRTDDQINFDWTAAPPAPSVPRYDFSVAWQGYFDFNSGPYTFAVIASDGIRMYVDGALVLDSWRDQPGTMYTVQRTLTAGQHLLRVDYYDHSGVAAAHVSWQAGSSGGRR